MEEILPNSSISESNNTRSLAEIDAVSKRNQEVASVMFEGKNIHSSPVDGKLLCSYSEKLCKQRRLNGYAFCIRHVLEDKNAPFKQCQYVAKYNGQQCTNPIPFPEDRIYCNSHLQVLGLVPKKNRKKKPSEGIEVATDPVSSLSVDSLHNKADVSLPPNSANMAFIPPSSFPRRHKKILNRVPRRRSEIPVINKQRECQKRLHENHKDLFKFYALESDSSDSSDNEGLPWQQVWVSSDSDHDQDLFSSHDRHEKVGHLKPDSDSRTAKISRLSARLRRELHQLRRTLRAHRYRQPHFIATASALLKAAQTNVSASVDLILENTAPTRTSPPPFVIKHCAFVSEDVKCDKSALPYAKFCSDHITRDTQQVLYAQCTAKWPGGLQCSVPVFDLVHERALCEEHARKKAKFQEAQEAAAAVSKLTTSVTKQPVKKPRRKPQPKAAANPKTTTKTKKPPSRKPASRSKPKASKVVQPVQNVSPLSNSFSPSESPAVFSPSIDVQMSSDFSHTSEASPVSPHLDDLQEFESSLFQTPQQDSLLIPDMDDEDSLCDNLTNASNGVVSRSETLFEGLSRNEEAKRAKWDALTCSSVPVITPTEGLIQSSSPLNSGRVVLPVSKAGMKSKSSPLNSKRKSESTSKTKRTSKSKGALAKQSTMFLPHSSLVNGNKDLKSHWTLSEDPMFSSSHGMLGGSDIKAHGNGLGAEHLPHNMDSVLSPQRSWPEAVISSSNHAYTSPLNSHTSQSRLTSPPFSPPSISPHTSPTSVFTFDRPAQYQQASLLSPTLSPASPTFLHAASLKQGVSYSRRDELEPTTGDDPFFMLVDQEQPMLGVHFHNSESALGDLRPR